MLVRPPVTFQGGKQRLAPAIVDVLSPRRDEPLSDLCCGSGAVTIEAVSRGFPPALVRMVDDGPWGLVWSEVGEGKFSLDALRHVVAAVPERKEDQGDFLRELRKQPADVDTSAVFLVLQAGAFGGKATSIVDGKWRWPGGAGVRKGRGTMFPKPAEILRRMEVLCELLRGVAGQQRDFFELTDLGGVVYVDPPYWGTSGYGRASVPYEFAEFAARNPDARVWVSEARPLGSNAYLMAEPSRQGGIQRRKAAMQEWLTLI